MTSGLVWNRRQDAQAAADGRQLREQEAREAEQRRQALARDLPYWKDGLQAHEAALVAWQENVRQAEAARAAAWQTYLARLHAETGGELPRAGGGQLIVAIDMGPHAHPDAVAGQRARFQWQMYQQAEHTLAHAKGVVLKLEMAIPQFRANVEMCEQAARGR